MVVREMRRPGVCRREPTDERAAPVAAIQYGHRRVVPSLRSAGEARARTFAAEDLAAFATNP